MTGCAVDRQCLTCVAWACAHKTRPGERDRRRLEPYRGGEKWLEGEHIWELKWVTIPTINWKLTVVKLHSTSVCSDRCSLGVLCFSHTVVRSQQL